MKTPSFDKIDITRLSPQSRWALENLAYPVRIEDAELETLADLHGLTRRVAKRMLDVLDAEVRAQQVGAELPELTKNEIVALELQLIRWGQVYPVVRARIGASKTLVTVDGANREALLEKLELPVKYADVEVKDLEEARALGLSLNLARRQMDAKRLRAVASAEILHDPKRSDRAIAEALGVHHATVGKARRELERLGKVDAVSTRVGRDGVEQTVATAPATPRREERLTEILRQLRHLAKSDERGSAHVSADSLIVEALALLGAEAIADTFKRIVART